jgi:hypothetical protein
MKLNVEPINGVAEFGSGFNALWHGTIMETDVALWRGLPVPIARDLRQSRFKFRGLAYVSILMVWMVSNSSGHMCFWIPCGMLTSFILALTHLKKSLRI